MILSYALHERALGFAKDYLRSEKELMGILIEMDEKKMWASLNYTGVFNYCVKALSFSESQASYFSSIVRKSREVPELAQAISKGELSVSKARRIVPVVTKETNAEWISKARTLPQKVLEKEVAKASPSLVKERLKPIADSRYELKLGMEERLQSDFQRTRDLICKKRGKNLTMEETLRELVTYFLEREDPVKRAERAREKSVKTTDSLEETPPQPAVIASVREVGYRKAQLSNEKRKQTRSIPAKILHEINLRDQGRCQVEGCENKRFTEIHHLVPFGRGGEHSTDNLLTVCSSHHKMAHTRTTGWS